MNMEKRQEELLHLRSYTEEIDKDLTMILQSLQWDRKQILLHPEMVQCKYDTNHKVIQCNIEEHEQECLLHINGYTKDDDFLPDPLDPDAKTLIKLSQDDIAHIIDNASKSDPTFKKGVGSGGVAPLSMARLQCALSPDERRAIHDAVVAAAPACHDLADLALNSVGEDDATPKTKTRTEILAELRDMRRRRTKYRVAAKSRNYSDVLRDVIKTQMELYNDVIGDTKPNIDEIGTSDSKRTCGNQNDDTHSRDDATDIYKRKTFSKHDDTDKDRERSRSTKLDRDRKESRRRESPSDRRHHSRGERDHRYRERPEEVKVEGRDDEKTYRDKTGAMRHRNKSRERGHDERNRNSRRSEKSFEPDQKQKPHQERSKRRYDGEYSRDKHKNEKPRGFDRAKEETRSDLSDAERARNLLMEIKREVKTADNDDTNNRENSTNTGVIEINQEKIYRDYISSNSRHRYEYKDDKYSDKRRDAEKYVGDRSTERNSKYNDEKRDHSKHKERDESSYRKKYKKTKDYERKESHKDKDEKKLRTEDKHKMYYEIYSEIDSRRQKYENK